MGGTSMRARSPGRAERAREREDLLAREQAAREQAEAATRARDQFLAVVSHELRSPLNGIQSWAHVAEQQVGAPTPAFRRAMTGIRKGIDQQVRLIEDLLDATRMLSGQLRIVRRPVGVRQILDAALDSIRPAARAKSVELLIDVGLAAEQVHADPDRLQQLLWNLLDNAVKFAPHGGWVRVKARATRGAVVVTVRDNGRGITPEFLPHLFDRFRQADASSTRRHDGLGLGLALVRHIAELHGGSVDAVSAGRWQGAAFTLTLPLFAALPALPRRRRDAGAAPPSLAGCRVLIVDDQRETRESLSALLRHAGAVTLTAGSCRQALALLETGVARADVLLCDIAMPDDDGYVTLRRVRAWESRSARAPMAAIALTAYAQRADRIDALAAGFRVYLTKPVSPATLVNAVADAQRARAVRAHGTGIAANALDGTAAEAGYGDESARRDEHGGAPDPGRRQREQRGANHARRGHRLPAGGAQ
jgi:CheY-like chemotaxis protein/nitrogen-specific signal transduction histidine kinase